MDSPRQVFRHIEFALDERLIDDHLCGDGAQFSLPPRFDLLLHRTEVPLHTIHSDGNRIEKVQRFRVLRDDRGKVAMNNIAKLPFELSVQISRTRLKPHRGTGIVEY
jgi:hypothetical protein